MKRNSLLASLILLSASALAADSPKADVTAAAKKLSDQSSYSWKSSTENAAAAQGGGGRFRPGPTEGKTEKGSTFLSMVRGENTTEAYLKGGKGAVKLQDGWKSLTEASADDGGGGFNPGRFLALTLQNYRLPAAEAEELAGKSKDLKAADGVVSGDLTEEGAKSFLAFRGFGGNAPEISGAKGSVKFWVKDGALTKYQYTVQGNIKFGDNDREVNRTTTVEIKDIGSTTVTVPEAAAKKLT